MDDPPGKTQPSTPKATTAPNLPAKTTLPPPARPNGRSKRVIIILAFVGVATIAAVIYYVVFLAPYETTDDAFIEAHVTTVSPRVSGLVTNLLVKDNQLVKAGDVLVELDRRDYEVRVAQAQADLALARAQLEQVRSQVDVDQAKAEQQQAATQVAEAESERAAADFKRFQTVQSEAVSQTQLDLAHTQALTTAASVLVSSNQAKAALAQVAYSRVSAEAAQARILQAQTALDLAELNLSYTAVKASTDGRVTMRTVEEGLNVQVGQGLMALVPPEIWVVANFKETQLGNMRPGQPVTMKIDAYPGRKFTGHVDSLQDGTGARFSLLPPENAVGNYVKVVQRVPVKILFDGSLDTNLDIAPGMSLEPTVKVK